MSTNEPDNPEDFPINDEDKPEVLAKPDTIERVAGTIITKVNAQGEDTPDADAECQVDMEGRALDGEVRPINLYVYSDHPEDMICSAEVTSDFTPRTLKTTHYKFFEANGTVRAEKYSHTVDTSKDTDKMIDIVRGSPEARSRVLDEIAAERNIAMEDEEFVREVGMQSPTETEMLELERLVLTSRII